jgi:putative ABC transport system substrate-binding protein
MRRREFIPLLGGVAAWPLAARAQAGGPKRRLGAIIGFAEDDPEVRFFVEAFDQGLRVLGDSMGAISGSTIDWPADMLQQQDQG